MTSCDRCAKAPATTHMEYREFSDEPHWRNQVTSRCASCAEELRGYIFLVKGFALVVDRPLNAPKES